MKYQAVVFDLDGTLTDSAPGIMASTRYALEQMDWPVPEEADLRKFLGPPLAESFMRFCGMNEAQAVQATTHYRTRYHSIGWLENKPYPGIRALLRTLKAAGIRLSIATGKPEDISARILERFELASFFDRVVGPGHNDYHARKEDLIARSLDGFPGTAVMIGDRGSDIEGARAYGIDSIAVSYGYGSKEELALARPTQTADSVEALYEMLGAGRPLPKGYLITLEGNDGCGKSTQQKLLAQRLTDCGFDVLATREPGGSDIAERIRAIVLDPANTGIQDMTEAYLYAAARAQHVRDVIEPGLKAGRLVISDRYVDSSVAYQGAGRELGMALVSQLNAPAVNGCLPNLTLLLDISAEAAMARRYEAGAADRMEQLDKAFHARVEAAFHELAASNPERIVTVSGEGSQEEVAERVVAVVLSRLKAAGLY